MLCGQKVISCLLEYKHLVAAFTGVVVLTVLFYKSVNPSIPVTEISNGMTWPLGIISPYSPLYSNIAGNVTQYSFTGSKGNEISYQLFLPGSYFHNAKR